VSVRKSSRGFTKDRRNPFELKVVLLEKHAQHPVINPHIHGVEHGQMSGWLIPSCLTSPVLFEVVPSPFASELLFFDNNKEYLTRSYSLEKRMPEYRRYSKQQSDQQLEVNICSELSPVVR
jgi:hypothetical protein